MFKAKVAFLGRKWEGTDIHLVCYCAGGLSPAHSPTPRGDISGTSSEDSPQNSPSAEDVQKENGYFPGDVPKGRVSPPVSTPRTTRAYVPQGCAQGNPQSAQRAGMTAEEVAEIVDEAVKRIVDSMNPDAAPAEDLPSVALPMEDVQLSEEKVNYRFVEL